MVISKIMAIMNALASMPVTDLRAACGWYRRLLGRVADSTPMPQVAEWKFERGGWLQVYHSPERAGFGSVTLAVSSLDEQIAHLQEIGIEAGPPMISATVKVVMIKDPDGNSIALAEANNPHVAQ